jgi:murein DD-endopeptidase MepM/ murein hydrolase activator NlpD
MASQRREVTLLVLPPNEHPSWRMRLPLRTLGIGFTSWTLLTLWAGIMAAHQADYWALKADNKVMRLKMSFLAEEIGKSKESVDRAEDADRRLREMLSLPTRRAIVESKAGDAAPAAAAPASSSAGGPRPLDRVDLLLRLRGLPPVQDPDAVRVQAALVRQESDQALGSFQEILDFLARERKVLRATPIGWPAPGRVTSPFGYRASPIDGEDGEFHPGLDIANVQGTPIIATADGVVRQAGWTRGYGRLVLIDHGRGFQTLFGHASLLLVKRGQQVRRGDIVARMGTTGRSTGSHLHYEVWVNGRPVNPRRYLKDPLLSSGGDAVAAAR